MERGVMSADAVVPVRPYGEKENSFQSAGGFEGLQKLSASFYGFMDSLPQAKVIREMHPQAQAESIDKLARFLSGWLGGPKLYREKYGPIAIPRAHAHLAIGSPERDAWLLCMERALAEQPYADDFKAYVLEQLFTPADRSRTLE